MNYQPRTIRLDTPERRRIAIAAIENAPQHVECVIREPVKVRRLNQNALMWAGPLKDLSEQAWVGGRTYRAEVWHEQMKREHLPEGDEEDLARLVKSPETYRKWDVTPSGERVLVGSTTDLTVYGFAQYMEAIFAYGAGLGVMFSASVSEPYAERPR